MQSICSSEVERFAENEIHTSLGTSEAAPQGNSEKKQRQAYDVSMPLGHPQPFFSTPFYVLASSDRLDDTERMARQGIRSYRNLGRCPRLVYVSPLGKGECSCRILRQSVHAASSRNCYISQLPLEATACSTPYRLDCDKISQLHNLFREFYLPN